MEILERGWDQSVEWKARLEEVGVFVLDKLSHRQNDLAPSEKMAELILKRERKKILEHLGCFKCLTFIIIIIVAALIQM